MASKTPQNMTDIYSDSSGSGKKKNTKKIWILSLTAVAVVAVAVAAFFAVRTINEQKAREAHEAEVAALLDTDSSMTES